MKMVSGHVDAKKADRGVIVTNIGFVLVLEILDVFPRLESHGKQLLVRILAN